MATLPKAMRTDGWPLCPTRISSKGQVIIPKALRGAKRWAAGTPLVAEQTVEGILLRQVALQKERAASVLRRIHKRVAYQSKAASTAEMHEAIAEEAARRGGR